MGAPISVCARTIAPTPLWFVDYLDIQHIAM
jgi:hypothetical protein